jgi:hypothetical protein
MKGMNFPEYTFYESRACMCGWNIVVDFWRENKKSCRFHLIDICLIFFFRKYSPMMQFCYATV